MPPIAANLPERREEPYSVDFFDLQLRFAQRVAEVLRKPFAAAVRKLRAVRGHEDPDGLAQERLVLPRIRHLELQQPADVP